MKITNTLAKLMLLSVSMAFSHQGIAQTPCPVPECQPLGSLGPMELSSTDLTNGARGYRGWFENGSWQGDLIEYTVSPEGGLSSSINVLEVPSPEQTGTANWSAYVQFADKGAAWWQNDRKIIFSNNYGNNQKAFRWEELDLHQKEALDSLTGVDATGNPSPVLNFIRGDRINEGAGNSMRTRFGILGDIIHSNPEYVGTPTGTYTDAAYVAFKNERRANRAPRVYVGANDGMLHAFNANNGNEEWAYVPSMLIPKMKRLAGQPYTHTYYVDGGITVRDAYVNGAWRTILVGSLGAGGRGLYALDVTTGTLTSEEVATNDNKKIMWEERAENTPGDPEVGANPDIGYIFDSSSIVQLNDDKWYAVFGNGIGSDNGQAVLMMKELRTDYTTTPTLKITTAGGTGNGLSSPTLVDTNNDGKVDVAWAGDAKGNMWRFDLSGSGGWNTSHKIYSGLATQPITSAPDVTRHPQFGHLVLFGTGKLYEESDLSSLDAQALYGVWDNGKVASYAIPPTTTSMKSQDLSFNTAYTRFTQNEKVRTFETNVAVDYATHRGWKVELYPGERMLTTPQLRASRLKTTIYNPNDGTNWLIEANFLDGNMAESTIYNLNRDLVLNEGDHVNANGNTDSDNNQDYSDPEDIPMAWQRPNGNMSQPTIASLRAGQDTMFLNFLDPPNVTTAVVPQGCTGNCAGGLEGGHIDLDYDQALGGGTDAHTHRYDDDANSTNIEYLNVVGQSNVQQVVNNSTDFIPLIANADFSKGATLIISRTGSSNDVNYNVVDYQKMIQQRLAAWDGTGDLTDGNGRSLVFNLNQIDDFMISFNSLALITGGLHPSVTGCVQGSDYPESGRWRNGSLTMHLVRRDLFDNLAVGESALDRLVVQTPVDFQEVVYPSSGDGVALTADLDGNGIIDGTGPAYEIYGGLHADPDRNSGNNVGSNGFLYESTMFWHFDGACYGQSSWADDYLRESQYSAIQIFLEILDRTGATSIDELVALIDGFIAQGCATEGGGGVGDSGKDDGSKDDGSKDDDKDGDPVVVVVDPVDPDAPASCQAEYDQAVIALALGLAIEANGGTVNCSADGCLVTDNGGDGTGNTEATNPMEISGGLDETGITTGPNFSAGRRTWIDILQQ